MTRLPSLSVVIATYNSEKTLMPCLRSIRNQTYPSGKIELIISDGGSTDNTVRLAKTFGAKIIRPNIRDQGAEINRAYGVHAANNEIVAMIDHDNVLPYARWFVDMVEPFIRDRSIVGAATLRYEYVPSATLLDRYFALFGVNDPLPFYMGKADRLSYLYDRYNLAGKAKDCGSYYAIRFQKKQISTLGANGFLIRRKVLLAHAHVWPPEIFFHIDVQVDLINKGFNKYAYVKNSIIHLSSHHDLISFFKRRRLFMEKYHLSDGSKRRYSVYEKQDFWKLVYFIGISVTIVKPTVDAIRGYRKIHDVAWFLHPIVCFWTVIIYGYTLVEWHVRRVFALYV